MRRAEEETKRLRAELLAAQSKPAPPVPQPQAQPMPPPPLPDKKAEEREKAARQLLEAAKLQSGSKEPNRNKVGKVNWAQVEAIAKDKMPDLNCFTLESAMKMVAGTARSMGLTVDGKAPWEN